MVNLEWYRTFKAIYQTGSLTAASRSLFISQPNVSQHLASLEAHVGNTLFVRKPGIAPTDYGKLLYTQVVEPLERLERVEAEFNAAHLKKQLPMIRLGAVQEYFQAVLSQHIATIKAHLVLSFGRSRELLDSLQKGTLDFVIATRLPGYKGIAFEPVRQENFIIAGSKAMDTKVFDRYIRAGDPVNAEAWLLSQTWIAYSTDLAIIRRFWQKNFNKRPVIKPNCVIPDMNIILKALKHSVGLTIAPDYMLDDDLKIIWSGNAPTENTLYLAYDKKKVTPDLVTLMKRFL